MLMSPPSLADHLFGAARTGLAELIDLRGVHDHLDDASWADLSVAEILVTGWGAPRLTGADLDRMPRLRVVFHAGGSVGAVVDPGELRRRDIVASNAGESNAVPVAEYTVAMILLATRQAWRAEAMYRQRRRYIDREVEFAEAGSYHRTVGIVGASRTGRKVIEMLQATDMTVLLYDPYITDDEARSLGAARVALAQLATRSDVVSIHAPQTSETIGLIDGTVLDLLRPGATLINTARGRLVDHDALRRRLARGDLTAVLDVSDPEPLLPDDPLWELPDVVLTPHIAGAMGSDLRRLGDHVTAEVARYRRGEPLRYEEL